MVRRQILAGPISTPRRKHPKAQKQKGEQAAGREKWEAVAPQGQFQICQTEKSRRCFTTLNVLSSAEAGTENGQCGRSMLSSLYRSKEGRMHKKSNIR